jgi:hypothetical protein
MLHATCTHENRVNSQLLMIGGQIVNLNPGLSFGHNLCFKRPNGQCEPILDIYISIDLKLYKEHFKMRSFDSCNRALNIWESFWDSNSQHGSSLGSVRVHSLTLFAFSGACDATPGCPSWPITLQPPCLSHEPKARVATLLVKFWPII